jgi:hypothetical protein
VKGVDLICGRVDRMKELQRGVGIACNKSVQANESFGLRIDEVKEPDQSGRGSGSQYNEFPLRQVD